MNPIKLKIHGCRGSTAYGSLENKIYGGNSSSYSLRTPENELIFLDAGTGILDAQNEFFNNKPKETYLLFSHLHHDHIEGLGISSLPYIKGLDLILIGRNIQEGLDSRFNLKNFPITFDLNILRGIKKVIEPKKKINNTKIKVLRGNHPGGVIGYKFDIHNKIIVYATDMEFDYNPKEEKLKDKYKKEYKKFIQNADILIADAQYTLEEYIHEKPSNVKGYGHSYAEQIIDMAAKSKVKKVILTHHSPLRTDKDLVKMEKSAKKYCKDKNYDLKTEFAKQGSEYTLKINKT